MVTSIDSHMMSADEAADYLGLRPQTLAKWRMTGIGPRYCKLGRAVRYELRELERYKRANTIGGDAAEEM